MYYDDPYSTLDRWIKNSISDDVPTKEFIHKGYSKFFSLKIWIYELFCLEFPDLRNNKRVKFLATKHHLSHASSAFYPSPFSEAVIITIDGVGEWTSLSIGIGKDNHIQIFDEIRYPHSLGLFYSAFTYYCGFKVNSGDYKFMGLAPYGKPIYYDVIKKYLIDIKDDGSFRLNLDYFDFQNGRTMINEKKMQVLFGGERRLPETEITKREMDIASSVQKVTEEIILKIASYAKNKYGHHIDCLCLAGGVALNCVANGKLAQSGLYKKIWVQPASGDAGGSLGAALFAYFYLENNPRITNEVLDSQQGSYLGPQYDDQDIKEFLHSNNVRYHQYNNTDKKIAELLVQQKIIGIFRGRMEFGPRSLGNRSIIADPRSPQMQSILNLKIKHRESFRPFAPSVLLEDAKEYFELPIPSPYMLICAKVKSSFQNSFDLHEMLNKSNMNMISVINTPRSLLPAITHVDFSARIQTVDGLSNPRFANLIKEFKAITGCGVLVNTSFNVRGEPIVCSIEDAFNCFMNTELDVLVLENFVIYKSEQANSTFKKRTISYELD